GADWEGGRLMSLHFRKTLVHDVIGDGVPSGKPQGIRWHVWKHGSAVAVEFWVRRAMPMSDGQIWGPTVSIDGEDYEAGGVEVHRAPSEDEADRARPVCGILGGPCIHHGSSLAASRFVEMWCGTDGEVWNMLAERLRRELAGEPT